MRRKKFSWNYSNRREESTSKSREHCHAWYTRNSRKCTQFKNNNEFTSITYMNWKSWTL